MPNDRIPERTYFQHAACRESYSTIAETLGLSRNTVKSFCQRNVCTDNTPSKIHENCEMCGNAIVQTAGYRKRRFCSDACRMAWWNTHRSLIGGHAKAVYTCHAKEIPSMMVQSAPVAQAPTVVQPAVVPQTTTQSVLVLDPSTGKYVRQEMTFALDPATGQYVPVMSEEEKTAAEKTAKEQAKQLKAAEAAERRLHMDDLREERAERARKNDSVLGRVKNTAISTATRSVVSQLTRGILGGLIGKK